MPEPVPMAAAVRAEDRGVFASRDPDETRAFMATRQFWLDIDPREATDFDFAASAYYMPSSYVGTVRYGAAADVLVPPERARDDYFIHLPETGSAEVVNGAGATLCAPGRAVVSSPRGHRTRSAAGSRRLTLSISRRGLERQLAGLLGAGVARVLDFAPALDLTRPEGQRLERLIRSTLRDLGDADLPSAPMLRERYEELVLTALLLTQPHSYAEDLARVGDFAAPRAIRRAVDFIEANLDRALTLGDIVAAAGVPGRTLLKQFADAKGRSPMRFLRDARLARIRDDLAARRHGSVTQTALSWGVQHLGRFAQAYRRRYGESPSDTWRGGGRAAPPVSDG